MEYPDESIFKNVDFTGEGGPLIPSAEVNRKGKKNTRFDEDPEILSRLSRVATYRLKGWPAFRIAEALGYPIGSAKRDIARVKALWRKEAKDALKNEMDAALAQYRLALTKAWELVESKPEKADRYLTLVIQAQERIDKITGANAPQEIKFTGETTVTVKDIEAVRKRRWAQVREALGVIGQVAVEEAKP